MRELQVICTVCPIGCSINVVGNDHSVQEMSGYQCPRGKKYATDEFIAPSRILTTSVRIRGSQEPLIPVRSSSPVPKKLLMQCMEEIKKITVDTPIKQGDVIIHNILGCNSDIIATATRK